MMKRDFTNWVDENELRYVNSELEEIDFFSQHNNFQVPWIKIIQPLLLSFQLPNVDAMFRNATLTKKKGLLLIGENGTGKHTTASFAVQHLLQGSFNNLIWLASEDFEDDEEEEVIQKLADLMEQLTTEDKRSFSPYSPNKTIIFFENFQDFPFLPVFCSKLNAIINQFADDDNSPFFIISSSEEIPSKFSAFSSVLFCCPFQLPTDDERKRYLEHFLVCIQKNEVLTESEKRKICLMNYSERNLVKKTENFNYDDLNYLLNLLKMDIVQHAYDFSRSETNYPLSKYPISEDTVSDLISLIRKNNSTSANIVQTLPISTVQTDTNNAFADMIAELTKSFKEIKTTSTNVTSVSVQENSGESLSAKINELAFGSKKDVYSPLKDQLLDL